MLSKKGTDFDINEMTASSKPARPNHFFEPRPFISQGKVAFEVPNSIVHDRKFDTAIRGSHIMEHKKRVLNETLTKDDKLILRSKNYSEVDINIDKSCKAHAYLMRERYNALVVNNSNRSHDKNQRKRVRRIVEMIEKNITFQSEYLNKHNSLPSLPRTRRALTKMFKSAGEDLNYIAGLIDLADWLLGVINLSNVMYADYYMNLSEDDYLDEVTKINFAIYRPNGLELSWSHQYCVFSLKGTNLLLPKAYILLFHNKICDLLSIIMYTKYAQQSTLPPGAYDTLLDFCFDLWDLHVEYGQKFFSIAKCLEGLATAESLIDVERWENTAFLDNIVKDIRKDTGFNYRGSFIQLTFQRADIPFRHELAALSKISGHPFVDMEEGSVSLHKYTTESYDLDNDKIFQCMCYVKQNYIRNHFLREGKWPPIMPLDVHVAEPLRMAWLLGLDPEGGEITRKYGKVKISDYSDVEFTKNLTYLKLENAIPYLKDKTISILRSDVVRKYINQEDVKTKWRDTRLLLYYLMHSGETTDHVEFIDQYSAGMDFEDFLDYLVIRIVPKEKELKVSYRGFGCTTFHNRMLFLTQEKTAMHYLDLYSDEQAMTLSELDLVKRLFTFRNLNKAYPRHRILYAMIDASKWNNHFRPETVDHIMAHTLDPIHGTNIFGKTQKKYENTMFYVPDESTTYYWDGQSGGIEGLNQDTWVITYIAQIKTALSGLDLKFHLLCKGDDLRIALVIPEHDPRADNIKKTTIEIMERLAKAAEGLGHQIKVYDSYASESYFNFSKSASVGNIELPQVYRKIQKCYGASNAFLPTMEEFIGSTFSNAHSACRVTTNFIPCYSVALFWTYYYLTSDKPTHSKYHRPQNPRDLEHKIHYLSFSDCSDSELVALTLVPSLLGGFPIIYLHNVMVRAESDLLSPFIDMVMFAKEKRYLEYTVVFTEFLKFPNEKHTTWKPVYKDPYCLPVKKPMSPTQFLRQQIIPSLKRITKAEDVKELLAAAADDDVNDKYIKSMDRSEICHAKVFSVVYSAFPEAVLDEFILKFESSRSVLELLILRTNRRRAMNILRRLVIAERNCSQWKLRKLKGILDEDLYDYSKYVKDCPAKSAEIIREIAWNKPIDGITMPPIAHLLRFTTPFQDSHDDHCRKNHFVYNYDYPTEFLTKQSSHHYAMGSRIPFIGHVTGTGTLNPTLHLVEKDTILTKLRNIAELVSWTDVQEYTKDGGTRLSNLRELVAGVIKMYTDMPLETLAPFLGRRKSGTIAHHIRLRHFREAVMPNSLANVYQCCVGESNTHSKFYGDQGHYWINFLQCHSHAICMGTFELNVCRTYSTPQEVWAVTTPCSHCMREVYEPAVVIDATCIKGSAFPELLATRLSKYAKEVLQASLCLARGRKYNLIGNDLELTPEVATTGIFQMLCAMSVSVSQRIVDRYTHHPPTREAYNILRNFFPATGHRVIGQREVSNMDDKTMTSCVIYTVISLIADYFTLRRIGDIELAMKTFPAYTLPWYPLLYELHRVGRLGILVESLAQEAHTQPIGISYNPDSCAAMVGVLCYRSLANWTGAVPFVILSDYEMSDIFQLVRRQMFRILWLDINTTLKAEMAIQGDEEEKLMKVGAYVLLLGASYELIPTVLEEEYELETENSSLVLTSLMRPRLDFLTDEGVITEQYLKLHFKIYARLISSVVDFDIPTLMNLILAIPGDFCEPVMNRFNQLRVNVTYTTAQACIETIRKCPSVFSQYTLDQVPTEHRMLPMEEYFDCRLPGVKDMVMRCPTLGEYLTSDVVEDAPIDREQFKSRIIHPAYLHRPYGSSNDTMNKLLFIYEYFQYNTDRERPCLKISTMGDGIGNGTAFLAGLHPKSHFVFTTRPLIHLHHTRPVVAEHIINATGSSCSFEHNLHGTYDLSEVHVRKYLTATFKAQHIYFCDAEPEPNGEDIFEVYENVTQYYLDTRYDNSILIMQVNSTNFERLARLLTVLRSCTENVYILQPPSERCFYGHYIVCWKSTSFVHDINWNNVKISYNMCAALNRYLKKTNSEHVRTLVEKPRSIQFVNLPVIRKYWHEQLPALWITYLRKRLNIFVPNETVYELVSATKLEQVKAYNPVPETIGRKLLAILQAQEDDQLYRAQVYNMNNRAHRSEICNLYMFWSGWCTIYKVRIVRKNRKVDEAFLRSSFYTSCTNLPLRDFDHTMNFTGIYTNRMKDPTGFELPYWKNFADGAEVCLSFIGWLHAGPNNPFRSSQ